MNFRLADALLRAGRARESIPLFRKVDRRGAALAPIPTSASPRPTPSSVGWPRRSRRSSGRSELDAGNGQAHYNLGEIARTRGDVAEARAQYDAARAGPGDARARGGSGCASLARGDGR